MTLISHMTVTDVEDDPEDDGPFVILIVEPKGRVFVDGLYRTREAAIAHAEYERSRGVIAAGRRRARPSGLTALSAPAAAQFNRRKNMI